ncbi:MAG: pilus assembly protein PilO [Cupriavidus sp.]|jgi:type IV pilus assembly protein PilO|uniref:type 4a pilus biogenesis protein PilO n=1 Tax=Cupriavidus pauculus TaxID=82633 RepID=UPI000780EB92|nr:type 4a pilus biogenesis protein PilO [Cupriavidus pauculus]KAB0602338.1 type 4a pilus biogenesis protein PilO [Cupriavidus pauculus]MBU70284.1 pilus assembly protein PilO [Cupriavidus sp.]MCM3608665.1 type 4a pilus biogenesis protein PilO [Cupriavidus pauculus]UAL00998.1 type 4a pilus biogenesis protein PilO [Cupriavidus pauculus]
MALNSDISLQDLTTQFRGLNLNEPETWPAAPRVLFSILAAVIVLILGWQFYWTDKSDELDRRHAENATLKTQFKTKVAQVANLDELRKQKVEVEKRVALAERQLPNSTEMDALLADVNHAGVARGLQFELFKPQPATVKPYFAEIPVNLKVTGRYHDVALFNADVAALSRIVSMRNLNMSVAKDGTLSMEAVAMAYRALDPDEQAAQRRAAADAAAKKTKAGGAK